MSTPSGHAIPKQRCFPSARSSASGSCRGHRSAKASSPAPSAKDQSFAANDIRSRFPRFTPEALDANQPVVDLINEIAARTGVTPGQVALAWLLAKSPSIVPIPGTRKIDRLRENIAAADVSLTAAEVADIDARSARLTVAGARGSGHENYG